MPDAPISSQPVRIGVARMTHDHINFILQRPHLGDIEVVGIAEAETAVVDRYDDKYGINHDLVPRCGGKQVSASIRRWVSAGGEAQSQKQFEGFLQPLWWRSLSHAAT